MWYPECDTRLSDTWWCRQRILSQCWQEERGQEGKFAQYLNLNISLLSCQSLVTCTFLVKRKYGHAFRNDLWCHIISRKNIAERLKYMILWLFKNATILHIYVEHLSNKAWIKFIYLPSVCPCVLLTNEEAPVLTNEEASGVSRSCLYLPDSARAWPSDTSTQLWLGSDLCNAQ